jgi:hypothetical protein
MKLRPPIPIAVLTTLVALAACSDDDSRSADRGADASVPTAVPEEGVAEEITPGAGGISADLETFGYAIESAMGDDIEDYEVDGTTLRIRARGDAEPSNDACMIVRMVAGSLELPEGAVIEVEYDDTVEDCGI